MANKVQKRTIFPTLLEVGSREPAEVARVVNNAVAGNLNIIGEVQIMTGTTETWIHDPRISPQSVVLFHAITQPSGPASFSFVFWLKERGTRKALYGHDAPAVDVWVEYVVFG